MASSERTRSLLQTFLLGGGIMALLISVDGGGLRASVFDGGGLLGGLGEAQNNLSGSGIRMDTDLILVIVSLINAILPYAAIATLIAFLTAGFLFILGFGSDTAIQRAKKIMIWSAVGLVVILFAFIITEFIIVIATTGNTSGSNAF